MLMKQVSLKKLNYIIIPNNINFTHFPGARDCLAGISELSCNSGVHPEFFYQISQMCHNIQSLNIHFSSGVSDGLKNLISSQNNLKYLSLRNQGWAELVPSLTKHSTSLIKLEIHGKGSLSFVANFQNLQELILSFNCYIKFNEFNELQYATFPRLQILKFAYDPPDARALIKFLEINGKNLKELYVCSTDNSLNLSIAKFCPNLKSLFTLFNNNEIETLNVVFNSCQQLESIESWCGSRYLKEGEMFQTIAKYSPENFYKLKLHKPTMMSKLPPKDLESFFISWKNRIPQKSLSFIFKSREKNDGIKKVIEKYKKLGIIK